MLHMSHSRMLCFTYLSLKPFALKLFRLDFLTYAPHTDTHNDPCKAPKGNAEARKNERQAKEDSEMCKEAEIEI